MKIYLMKDFPALGKKGEIVNVSDGYARNFLLPRGIGAVADAKLENDVKNSESSKAYRAAQELAAAKELAKKIEGITLVFETGSVDDGRLYGAFTNAHAAELLEKQHGISIDKRKIEMTNIKSLGDYTATLRLYSGVSAELKIKVTNKD